MTPARIGFALTALALIATVLLLATDHAVWAACAAFCCGQWWAQSWEGR